MKQLFALIAIISLVGCASHTVPVVIPFPSVPDDLKVACPDLARVDENTQKLSDILDAVTNNYQAYYDCQSKVNDWNDWYKTQQHIQNNIK